MCAPGTTQPTPEAFKCKQGGYCATASVFKHCPAGTHGNRSGGTGRLDACAVCPPTFYCPEGSPLPIGPCPTGHYCPAGTKFAKQWACPGGTYSDATNLVRVTTCKACPQGYYCPPGSVAGTNRPCPAGYFCPASTSAYDEHPCPIGTYSGQVERLIDASQCTVRAPAAYSSPANPSLLI